LQYLQDLIKELIPDYYKAITIEEFTKYYNDKYKEEKERNKNDLIKLFFDDEERLKIISDMFEKIGYDNFYILFRIITTILSKIDSQICLTIFFCLIDIKNYEKLTFHENNIIMIMDYVDFKNKNIFYTDYDIIQHNKFFLLRNIQDDKVKKEKDKDKYKDYVSFNKKRTFNNLYYYERINKYLYVFYDFSELLKKVNPIIKKCGIPKEQLLKIPCISFSEDTKKILKDIKPIYPNKFFNKYIKYKNKYLELKKLMI
jgi:hypothetical protein